MSFFNELKRRNVFKVTIAYVVLAWLVMQVADVILNNIEAPGWVFHVLLLFLSIGLPFSVFFAWAYEMTPEGLKREHEIDRDQSITQKTGRKLDYAIIGVMALALGYFTYDKFVLDVSRDAELVETAKQEAIDQVEPTPAVVAETEKTIAVIPFVNMSGDQENEYFSDGLTEELLNSLAGIKELKVTGRTSSFAFKGKNIDLREIGQALGVAHILEGSVRKAQNRVRITAQLIKADDGYHLWSATYDRELDDIFAIQEDIATRVVAELTSTLLGEGPGRLVLPGTDDTGAYEAYLRGRYLFQRSPDDIQVQNQAEKLFQRALELDPQFTLAWYGQFRVMSFRQRAGQSDYKQAAIQMRELAEKMIAMDPDLPESYVAMSRVTLIEMNWEEMEEVTNKALLLNPGNIDAVNAKAALYALLDRHEEAVQLALDGLERDPLDILALGGVAFGYAGTGECQKLEEIVSRALSLVPEASRFNGLLADCWMLKQGDYKKAIEFYEFEPLGFKRLTGLAIAYEKLGQRETAQQYLDQLIKQEGEAASYQHGQVYAQWGETDRALDALEHAWDISDTGFVLLNIDDNLDSLREHPRFIALLEKWRDPTAR